MVVMIYAVVVFNVRARAIRLRTGAPYDDRIGPVSVFRDRVVWMLMRQTVLCAVLLGEFDPPGGAQ